MLYGISGSAVQCCNALRVAEVRALGKQQQGAGEYGHLLLAHLELGYCTNVPQQRGREWRL